MLTATGNKIIKRWYYLPPCRLFITTSYLYRQGYVCASVCVSHAYFVIKKTTILLIFWYHVK